MTIVSCSCVRKASPSWLREPADTLHPCRLGGSLQRCLNCRVNNGQAAGVVSQPDSNTSRHRHHKLAHVSDRVCNSKAWMPCRLEPCSKAVLDAVSGDNSQAESLLALPDTLVIAMLEREQLLTKAKLHEMNFRRVCMEIRVYHLRRLISLVSLAPMLCPHP